MLTIPEHLPFVPTYPWFCFTRESSPLSHATVLIKSQSKRGSMITENFAHQYHQEVFAFPVQAGNPLSWVFHDLIRSQKTPL